MRKRLLIVMLISIKCAESLYAQQWNREDSVMLQNILSGKKELQLNPEAMEAIKSGTLINPDIPILDMQMAPSSSLPVLKDFSEYIREDTTRRKVALKDLPPSVFWLYGPKSAKLPMVYQSIKDEMKRDPLFQSGGGGLFFDLGELTSRKTYIHRRNSKRDATWKNYNNLPTPDIIHKKKQFARDNPHIAGKDTLLIRKDSIIEIKNLRN